MARSDLAQELQWLMEAIQDDVEGVRASTSGKHGTLNWIRDGVVYSARIEKIATRISGPGPGANPLSPLDFVEQLSAQAREIEIRAQDMDQYLFDVPEIEVELHGEIACAHGVVRGQFCKTCDEEPE